MWTPAWNKLTDSICGGCRQRGVADGVSVDTEDLRSTTELRPRRRWLDLERDRDRLQNREGAHVGEKTGFLVFLKNILPSYKTCMTNKKKNIGLILLNQSCHLISNYA